MTGVKKINAANEQEKTCLHHVPWRTCVVCGVKNPKRGLIRLVRNAQGEIEIDLRGKTAGRGAYLCRAQGCWQTALKSKRLEHALRVALSAQKRQEFSQFGNSLPS